jgi:elongation factor G
MKAYTFAADESGRMTEVQIPEGLVAETDAARAALIEMVAEVDDSLMEKFFEAGTLTQDELTAGLVRSIRAARLFPVFCASAIRNIGAQPLASAITTYAPSPLDRPFGGTTPAGEAGTLEAKDSGPLLIWVWKTMADQFAGRVTLFRVLSGVLHSDSTVHNLTRDASERIGHVLVLEGKAQTHVPELHAGDLGAVAKLRDTRTNDRLGDRTKTRLGRPCSDSSRRTRPLATPAIRRRTTCCSPGRVSSTSR